jgi:glutamine synthetase adenylyltransferase
VRRFITLAAISAAALFALPTMSAHAQTTPISVSDASDFAQEFTADNSGDLIRNTVVRRSRVLGCLADNANSSVDCALLVTLERRRTTANNNSCNTCANGARVAKSSKARIVTPLRRWQCLVVVRVTATDTAAVDDTADVTDEFTGDFAFDNCVRVRPRPVVNPL